METITLAVDQTACITEDLEVTVHAINDHNGKCILVVTEHNEDTLSVVERGDTVVFHSSPVHVVVGQIAGQKITLGLGVTTVH